MYLPPTSSKLVFINSNVVSAMGFNKMYGIDIAHAQLISAGYRYEFADNRYTKVTIFIG